MTIKQELAQKREEFYAAYERMMVVQDIDNDAILSLCDEYRELVKKLNKQRKREGKRPLRVYNAKLTARYLIGARPSTINFCTPIGQILNR